MKKWFQSYREIQLSNSRDRNHGTANSDADNGDPTSDTEDPNVSKTAPNKLNEGYHKFFHLFSDLFEKSNFVTFFLPRSWW